MVENFMRPRDEAEALRIVQANSKARFLAGGTYLLTGQFIREPMDLVSLEAILPTTLSLEKTGQGKMLCIGAGASFQDLVDSPIVPSQIKKACQSMVDRNIRNRATVGGNIGADKSCASLVPLFISLGASYRCSGAKEMEAQAWHLWTRAARSAIQAAKSAKTSGLAQASPSLVLEVRIPLQGETLCAFDRHSRTGCDLSILTCAVSIREKEGNLLPSSLRICMGGLGPHAERNPKLEEEIAGLFKGGILPSKESIEKTAQGCLFAKSDSRGGAEFKILRSAVLLADALHSLEVLA
jgi:CO/xanthine dehydrogenase FAD-binding subunit